jgi:FtsH-binding integral membrane protein
MVVLDLSIRETLQNYCENVIFHLHYYLVVVLIVAMVVTVINEGEATVFVHVYIAPMALLVVARIEIQQEQSVFDDRIVDVDVAVAMVLVKVVE